MKVTYLLASITCLSVLAVGATSYQAWRYRSAAIESQAKADQLATTLVGVNQRASIARAAVLRVASTSSETQEPYAALRDYVFRTNIVGASETASGGEAKFFKLGLPGFEQLCGGMSEAYAWALNASEIPARTVQLATQSYLDGNELADTHVTVEAYVDGKWRISDPTYNAEFDCSDGTKSLSIEEAHQCIVSGQELVTREGPTHIASRSQSTPFSSYLDAYDIAAYTGADFSTAPISFPPGWKDEALLLYNRQ